MAPTPIFAATMKAIYIFFILIGALTSSCSNSKCEKAEGPRTARIIQTGDYSEFVLDMVADVIIELDSNRAAFIEIVAQDQMHGMIRSENNAGELTVLLKGCVKENEIPLINAWSKDFDRIRLESAGRIESRSIVEREELRLSNYGLGDIDFVVNNKRLIAEIKSSGDLTLGGSCDQFDFLTTSSGDLHAFNLVTDTINLNVFGSSVCEVYTNGVLNIHFFEIGTVNYRGTPSQINIIGPGDVKNVNL